MVGVPTTTFSVFRGLCLWSLGADSWTHCSRNNLTMAAPASAYKDRQFLAVIGDEVSSIRLWSLHIMLTRLQDSVTGLLLAGIGVGDLPIVPPSRCRSLWERSMSPNPPIRKRTFSLSTARPTMRLSKKPLRGSQLRERISEFC